MTQTDNASNVSSDRATSSAPPRPGGGGPLAWLLGLFSSVWFGIFLMVVLFVYCTLGSCGLVYPIATNIFTFDNWTQLMVRQLRGLEMTEYEWFNWWPFSLLIGLICVTLVTATIRRIKLNSVNLGVWMIHSGLIILSLGSVWYFSTKLEGDAPVIRRQVVLELPSGERQVIPALPGNSTTIGGYTVQVGSIDPQWELLSGEDKGERAYSVNLFVNGGPQPYIRQLLAGYPQYTEDILPGKGRAVKSTGNVLVDETLVATLEYQPQDYFYLSNQIEKSWALYLREEGGAWSERPISGLPLYNDYVSSLSDVWPATGLETDPLSISVASKEPGDPLAGQDMGITAYLRYAQMTSRQVAGQDLNPTAMVRFKAADGRTKDTRLIAFDAQQRSAESGKLRFVHIRSEQEQAALMERREPRLFLSTPGDEAPTVTPIRAASSQDPELAYTAIGDSGYSYRVQTVQNELVFDEHIISLAILEMRAPDGRAFTRWVFDDPALTKDLPSGEMDSIDPHATDVTLDRNVDITYMPGLPPITLVAGPAEDELHALFIIGDEEPRLEVAAIGRELTVGEGISMTVTSYMARTRNETRPTIVPTAQRNRSGGLLYSMVRVSVPYSGGSYDVWVPYHHYPFPDEQYNLIRYRYDPTRVRMPNGRVIEIILSRQRVPLPDPVVLDDFILTAHVGGFTGQTTSIRDWTSKVQFRSDDGVLGDAKTVSVNSPIEHGGFWYFQAQWDPPIAARSEGDTGSAGLNFTVLGVGNRNGVLVQLLGCCIAVIGMIYAFYVKPAIKRRQRRLVLQQLEQSRAEKPAAAEAYAAVPVAMTEEGA